MNVHDPWAVKWITQTSEGKKWAKDLGFKNPIFFSPARECTADDPHPKLEITAPNVSAHISDQSVDVSIVADATGNFKDWTLEWAPGEIPGNHDWKELDGSKNAVPNSKNVASLNLEDLPARPHFAAANH